MSDSLDAHVAVGEVIGGRYEVEALLGEGGLAVVYRVRHRELGSRHALKLLSWRKPSLQRRLVLEGRIQAQLRHPNIVAVTDLVQHDGQTGLLMELVDGPGDLDAWLDAHGAVPFDEAMALFACMLSALATAHDAGVAHRDLKPANVLLAGSGSTGAFDFVPKIADFGIAKLVAEESGGTRMGATMGTPGYLAPEQVEDSSSIDARADIFALGAILYELLTGRQAFADPNTGRIEVSSTATRSPCPIGTWMPTCPPVVAEAIERALAKDPDDRFQDCRAFAEALFVAHPELLDHFSEQVESRHSGSAKDSIDRPLGPSLPPEPAVSTMALTPAQPEVRPPPVPSPSRAPSRPPPRMRTRRWTHATLVGAGVLAGGVGIGIVLALWFVPPMVEDMLTDDAPPVTVPPAIPPPATPPRGVPPVDVPSVDVAAIPESVAQPTPAPAPPAPAPPTPHAPPPVDPTPPAPPAEPPVAPAPPPSERPVVDALPEPPPPEPASPPVPEPASVANDPAPPSPMPRPALDPPDLTGSWTGMGSGHQLELVIPDQGGEQFDGMLTRIVGGRPQKEGARGTITAAGTIEIRSGTWRFQGRLDGGRLSGTVTRGGRAMGDWFLDKSI